MKSKHEITAIVIMLVFCLIFAACAQKVEDKLTNKATDPSLLTSTSADKKAGSGNSNGTNEEPSPDDAKPITAVSEKEKTTEESASSIEADVALDELKNFYGSLYTVTEDSGKGSKKNYKVTDKNGKEYARVTVDLSTADVTETITGTGEVNHWNMLV